MPSYRTRAWHVRLWAEALGDVPRDALTAAQVSAQLHQWLADGFSPQTCNHLRTALVQVYVRLDGKEARNPARAVPKLRTEAPVARTLPVLAVARILHALRPMTGLSHAEVMRLQPGDVNLEAGHVLARARRKGAGSQPRTIPLTRHARLALRAFVRLQA